MKRVNLLLIKCTAQVRPSVGMATGSQFHKLATATKSVATGAQHNLDTDDNKLQVNMISIIKLELN